ncbi:hypothetical protein MKW98_031070 [Papaver atlanticum]|uniref:FLZ-type domain-containing protein n=1 Tax=Papaver atlanticum TaxID=357466 RepID=A0AAD4XMN6_9MAGN|nr:hypothetical protein MKW98_031070 [Papaver atlanticum]
MLITTKTTTSPSVTILEIKTQHDQEFMNVSPTNHISTEPRILSPRYSKNRTGGGVGLGIVAALETFSCTVDGEKTVTKLTCGTNPSNPIAISTISKYTNGINLKGFEGLGSVEMRSQRLYKWRQVGVFYESPSYNTSPVTRDYPLSDFLSSCFLCRKKLHGKDIYMYRGEKAFCSTECRYQQIAADERKDKKRPRRRNEVSRSSFDISSPAGGSPYLEDHLFSHGIMAI